MSFGNKWIKPHSESVGNKLLEGIKPQAPLKPRIEEAQKRLQMQISKLDSIATKTLEKDHLFSNAWFMQCKTMTANTLKYYPENCPKFVK